MEDDSEFESDETRESVSSRPRKRAPRRPAQNPRPKAFKCPDCERSFDRPSLLAQVCETNNTFFRNGRTTDRTGPS